MRYWTPLVAAALLLAAGCGNIDGQANSVESTVTAPTSAAASTATNTPEALGAELTFTGANATEVRVTVLNFDPTVATAAPGPSGGGHWAGAEVRTCVDSASSNISVSWDEWSAIDATNGRYGAANITYGQFPIPAYPFTPETVNTGECVRGWVVFPVADGAQIDRVRYTPNDSANATWSTAGATEPAAPPPSEALEPEPDVESTSPSDNAPMVTPEPASEPRVGTQEPYVVECLFGTPGPARWSDGTVAFSQECYEQGAASVEAEHNCSDRAWRESMGAEGDAICGGSRPR